MIKLREFVILNTIICTGIFIQFAGPGQNKSKIFELEGQQVKVTHQVEPHFYGRYEGDKSGYLLLNENGTGEYLYDVYTSTLAGCTQGVIEFEWGFLLDEEDEIVRFERNYGYSYPVIYRAIGERSFQGCQKTFMVDYILIKQSGKLVVSSSDDWEKIL